MDKTNVTRMLDTKKIPYKLFKLPDNRKINAVETAELIGVSTDFVYKTIVVSRTKPGKYILAVVSATSEVDLKALAAFLNEKKLTIPSQDKAEEITGLLAGGISPLALIHRGFQVVIDSTAIDKGEIHVSGGQRGMNIRIPVLKLIEITNARVAKVSRNITANNESFE